MREGEHVLTFSLSSFILMHLIFLPSSFVEHLSFPINLHQSLSPCWVKNCTHYFCHVVYRNSILYTDKRQVKQLTVTHKTAGRRQHSINHSQILEKLSYSKVKSKVWGNGCTSQIMQALQLIQTAVAPVLTRTRK